MSIFTTVTPQQMMAHIASYEIGTLKEIAGVDNGITNTIYRLTTDQGQFILTLFEDLNADELPFFLDLTDFMAVQNLPCAKTIPNKNNDTILILNDKPAVIVEFLPGDIVTQPTLKQCHAIGDALGKLHVAGQNFSQYRPNPRGKVWRNEAIECLLDKLPSRDALMLQEEMGFQHTKDFSALPKGIIHADLFPDNVLFTGNEITALLDFYYACHDTLLLDVATTVNCWCLDKEGQFDETYVIALLDAYQNHRPFTPIEKTHWHAMRRVAALRFWLSRLLDTHYPAAGEKVLVKDPNEFRDILHQLTALPIS